MSGATGRLRRAAELGLIGLMVIGLALLMRAFANPFDARGAMPLLEGWRVEIEGEVGYDAVSGFGRYIDVPTGRALTMTRAMKERAEDASILLHLNYLSARVWLDGALIYTNESDPPGPDKGVRDALIALPGDYWGRTLTVEVSSAYEATSHSPDPIWFGSAQALAAHDRGSAVGSVALMCPLILSGLALMLFALVTRAGLDAFCFGLLSALFALWLPGQGASYLGALEPRMTGRLILAVFCLYPVPLLWFVYLKCGATRRFARVLAAVYSAAAACATVAIGSTLVAPPMVSAWMYPALLVGLTGALVLSILEWLHGNPFFRMTSPAFLTLALGGGLMTLHLPGSFAPRAVLITGAMLLVVLVWVDMLRTYLLQRGREVEQRQLLSLREHLAGEQLEAADARSHETRLLRHEMRRHMSALSMLQREGKLSEMGAYLAQLDAQDQALAPARYCEHPLVNAILDKAGRDCARHGVAFNCEADVPGGIRLADSDLSALLLNMLDNAIEAAQQVGGAEKWVSVQMHLRGNFLVIHCANTFAGTVRREGERYMTTKKDAHFHGYGLLAMRRAVERNGGKLSIDHDALRFNVNAILRLGDDQS